LLQIGLDGGYEKRFELLDIIGGNTEKHKEKSLVSIFKVEIID
jgi:hypothetical protein